MPRAQWKSMLRSLPRAVFPFHTTDLTDGELLERYLDARDEGSFEVLLHRHGPMVLGVCRRVLQNEDDAHDAFQATFLVFLRKAATIVPRALVGNWLHGVAYKTALKAQAMNRQRRAKEREARSGEQRTPADNALQDRLELLDEALNRLPAKYRSAIVLCDLEGKTIKEAAKQLACPPGTVASRLTGGRTLLAKRLTRHGLCLTAATLAKELAQGAGPPSIPGSLLASTVQAAASVAAGQQVAHVMSAKVVVLTERVVKAMLIAKLKTLTTVLVAVGLVGAGGVLWTHAAANAQPQEDQASQTQSGGLVHLTGEALMALKERGMALATDEKPKSDKELLQGAWMTVSIEQNGAPLAKEKFEGGKLVFTEDKILLQVQAREGREGTYKIDPDKKPKEIDMTFGNFTMPGLYELKGTTLKVVMSERARPTDFDSAGATLVVLERKK